METNINFFGGHQNWNCMWKPKLNFQKETKIKFLGGKQKWNFGRIPKYKFKPETKDQILGGKRDLKLSRKPKIVEGIQNFIKENKKMIWAGIVVPLSHRKEEF